MAFTVLGHCTHVGKPLVSVVGCSGHRIPVFPRVAIDQSRALIQGSRRHPNLELVAKHSSISHLRRSGHLRHKKVESHPMKSLGTVQAGFSGVVTFSRSHINYPTLRVKPAFTASLVKPEPQQHVSTSILVLRFSVFVVKKHS